MINFVQMKLNKFAYLYSKPLGNHTLKIMKKYLEIYFKKTGKSWKYHGIFQSEKVGTLKKDLICSSASMCKGITFVASIIEICSEYFLMRLL